MTGQTAISLNNVGAFFWRRDGYFRKSPYWALKDVTFDLYHGESLGVIGRNGAGKSTLLRMLAGILSPDRGTMINHGVKATLLSLQIGFVPYLSGRQNALLSGMLLGLKKSEIEANLEEIKGFSELGDFFEQPINTYSSGMKARLGFSVAFQLDPDVLLVDEVLGVGDADFREKSSKAIQDKIRSDKTIVLVSHNANTIQQLCDRTVWIEGGVTQETGKTSKVLEQYKKFQKKRCE